MSENKEEARQEFEKRNDGQVEPQKSVAPKVSPGTPKQPPPDGDD